MVVKRQRPKLIDRPGGAGRPGDQGELRAGLRADLADDEADRPRHLAPGGERDLAELGDVGATGQRIGDRRPGCLGQSLDPFAQATVEPQGDAEAHPGPPANVDDGLGIEPGVGPDGDVARRAGGPDPGERLGEEVGGAADRVRAARAEPGMEDGTRAGGDGEERVITAHAVVREPSRPLLGQPVYLADRGIEIDRQRAGPGTDAGRPAPGEEVTGDPVELADVAQRKLLRNVPSVDAA